MPTTSSARQDPSLATSGAVGFVGTSPHSTPSAVPYPSSSNLSVVDKSPLATTLSVLAIMRTIPGGFTPCAAQMLTFVFSAGFSALKASRVQEKARPFTTRSSSSLNSFWTTFPSRSEEHTSELQSLAYLVCRLLLEKKKILTVCLTIA